MLKVVLLSIFIASIVLPQPAHAYIDPSAGAYLVQALVGFVLVASASVRSLFGFRKKAKTAELEIESSSQQSP